MCGLILAVVSAIALAANPALAHRFNVTLVIPLSGDIADQGGRFREGFMQATTERDSHLDQESDGHLGGLDVYVRAVDARGDFRAELGQNLADIVVMLGSGETMSRIESILRGTKAILLPPGQPPFAKPAGLELSPLALRGYNAARRIDVAVRAQGGTADSASLRRSFAVTARGFTR
jgi:hypothetical protein